MAQAINRLVILRKAKATDIDRADFQSKFGQRLASAEVLQILPVAWDGTLDPSHEGYVLAGLTLKDLRALEAWERDVTYSTVFKLDKPDDAHVIAALAPALRLHPNIERGV